METLEEIQAAVERLSVLEKRRLLQSLADSLDRAPAERPSPRIFSNETLKQWMDEDERGMQEFLAKK
jgi:hypothetical protein